MLLGWCECGEPIESLPYRCPSCDIYYDKQYDWTGKEELAALRAKSERLAALCRSMLRYLEITGAHSVVEDHKNCAPCQFEREFEEIIDGR